MADDEVFVASEPYVVQSVLDNYYIDVYGEQAATVASVVALGSHAELFDRAEYDQEIVESYFLRVPNSTLIVNRVDTNDQYGLSKSFAVLDGDEPLLQLDGGRLAFNNLTPAQSEVLQQGQRELASPLLVSETFFQTDVVQALTTEGVDRARDLLSQGDAITPGMVTALHDLMAEEEDIRREHQRSNGRSGDVSYPRFTVYELHANRSIDMIARQLSAQSLVEEVQADVPHEQSLDQERSQAVVQEPPVAGYESNANPYLQGKANVMVAVEAPVQATEIDLRDLMSQKTLGIMETGKIPQQRVEVDGKTQLVDRTPEEGLAMVARAAYGAKNFCEENSLPHTSHLELITTAAESLSLNGPEVTAVLDSIEEDKCRPVMEVATRSQAGVWARIEEKYPEYADKVPEAIKVERAALPVVTEAKAAVTEATTCQVPAPVLKPKEAQAQLPTQFEMAVTVAAYNLQKASVDRMGHDNDKAKVIFNRSKDGNISVINKEDNTIIASRNAVTGQVLPGVLPEGQDYTKAYAAVVQMQTEKYTAKTAVAAPKAKAKAGDGR